jgi:hypothetical protein
MDACAPVTKKCALHSFLQLAKDIAACRDQSLTGFAQTELYTQVQRGMFLLCFYLVLVMTRRVCSGRLHHATLSIPLSNIVFFLHVWPVAQQHDLRAKFGYRQLTRGTASYYAHSWFQLTSMELVEQALGTQFVADKPWGTEPIPPFTEEPCKLWDGGVLRLVISSSVPLTVHVRCLAFSFLPM